ncbi:MAG TPA: YkgJ family cysteine cluster protein [Bryobacteraceae bacterium]|jgi:Fe-S-cluster containining protein|nr:YkgJ family cysteine cluster protein [Bryobacteraceae bacterium]
MTGDGALIQIVDAAMAEAARKSGSWLVCRLGCTQCCLGPFAINQLDVRRLRQGLEELESRDPHRAGQVRERARRSLARLAAGFPGDPETGILGETEEAEARFADFAGDEPCPALDPETGGCDLYSSRPMTCRTFGPPVRCGPEAVGVCELCFEGATDEQIAACEVEVDPDGVEAGLLDQLERATGQAGRTIVAYALLTHPPGPVPAPG